MLIPLHSSENRKYIPIGFFSEDYIANNSTSVVSNATVFDLGSVTDKEFPHKYSVYCTHNSHTENSLFAYEDIYIGFNTNIYYFCTQIKINAPP
ncbi:MAG: type IIL restriction-modification enzyme MmeI [Bacteroidota bacterium]|nr:type IIL restriction-modification enzyme MmeI [Bacteroidota bacterium]